MQSIIKYNIESMIFSNNVKQEVFIISINITYLIVAFDILIITSLGLVITFI